MEESSIVSFIGRMTRSYARPFLAVIRRRRQPGYVVDQAEATVWTAAYTNAMTNLGMNAEEAGNFADEAVRMRAR